MTIEQFWASLDRTADCWFWTGKRQWRGYGLLWFCRRDWRAHRLAYTLAVGEIPDGLYVLHACDNRLCCNPEHLYVGDHTQNMDDMLARGRSAAGERHQAAKLRAADIPHIRTLRESGLSTSQLAPMFGVHQRTIQRIVERKLWQCVPVSPSAAPSAGGNET